MFAFLKGIANCLDDNLVAIDVNGVGYEVFVSRKAEIKNGEAITLYTHLIHKEDLMALYGFRTREEKKMFNILMTAQGVGAKLSLEILSTYSVSEIMNILFSKDINALKKVSGMGLKKAEKVLFELKDKIDKIDIVINESSVVAKSSNQTDATKALISLGFSSVEANKSMEGIEDIESLSVEKIITLALKNLNNI